METSYDAIIVGGGLSGLTVAHFLKKKNPGLSVIVLEKSDRAGGAIRSFQEKGFLAEWGPHGFLDNCEESRELLADTGLDRVAQKASLKNFLRYVCHQGRLVALPQNPKKLLATPLLTLPGKFRLLADLWKKPILEEQSLGEWAEHRFGRQILPLVDAAATGTFAGDYSRLSIDAVMPGIRKVEKEYGSVLRGLIKKQKQGPKRGLPAMTSFPQGMEQLVTTLASRTNVHYKTGVEAINRDSSSWRIKTGNGPLSCRTLVLALPVNQCLPLLSGFGPPASAIPESRIVTVAMGFTDRATIPYGFGYLAPEKESRFTLGVLFSTHMFPGRAPVGNVLIEALVGGRRHPERLSLTDDEIISNVYQDIRQLMDLPEPPWFTRVLRSAGGIPQLEKGHPALLGWKETLECSQPGLHICGFGWEGIGMNEMVKHGKRVAQAAAAGREEEKEEAKIKPVYF